MATELLYGSLSTRQDKDKSNDEKINRCVNKYEAEKYNILKILKKFGNARIGLTKYEEKMVMDWFFCFYFKLVYKKAKRTWTFLLSFSDERFQIQCLPTAIPNEEISIDESRELRNRVVTLYEFQDWVTIERLEKKLQNIISLL